MMLDGSFSPRPQAQRCECGRPGTIKDPEEFEVWFCGPCWRARTPADQRKQLGQSLYPKPATAPPEPAPALPVMVAPPELKPSPEPEPELEPSIPEAPMPTVEVVAPPKPKPAPRLCTWPGCDRTTKWGLCCVRCYQRFGTVMETAYTNSTPQADIKEAARRWETRQQARVTPTKATPDAGELPTSIPATVTLKADPPEADLHAQIAQLQAELAQEKERRQDAARVAQEAEKQLRARKASRMEMTETELKTRFGKLEDAIHLQRLLAPEAQTIDLDGRVVPLTPQIRDFLTRYAAQLRKEALGSLGGEA